MSLRNAMLLTAALALIAAALGLYWKGRRDGVAHERPRTEVAQAQAEVAKLETQGARLSATQVSAAVARRDAASSATERVAAQALTSEDAHAPLDPTRAARLRADDVELCRTAPELAGCAAH